MTGLTVAAVVVVVAGVVQMLLAIGWALGRAAAPWPGPESHRGPLLLLGSGTAFLVGGFVWAVMLS